MLRGGLVQLFTQSIDLRYRERSLFQELGIAVCHRDPVLSQLVLPKTQGRKNRGEFTRIKYVLVSWKYE